jgi:hypothetical protein
MTLPRVGPRFAGGAIGAATGFVAALAAVTFLGDSIVLGGSQPAIGLPGDGIGQLAIWIAIAAAVAATISGAAEGNHVRTAPLTATVIVAILTDLLTIMLLTVCSLAIYATQTEINLTGGVTAIASVVVLAPFGSAATIPVIPFVLADAMAWALIMRFALRLIGMPMAVANVRADIRNAVWIAGSAAAVLVVLLILVSALLTSLPAGD